MRTIVQDMTLQEILRRHNILAASELRRRIVGEHGQPKLSRAQAHNLWSGKVGVGKETMRLLHDHLGLSYEDLMQVEAVPRKSPTGGRPGRPSLPKDGKGRRPQR